MRLHAADPARIPDHDLGGISDLVQRGSRRVIEWWTDGLHFNLRGDIDDRACLLVIRGVLPDATRDLVGLDDGQRESAHSGHELLVHLRDSQGLTSTPRPAIGDGAPARGHASAHQ